MNIFILHVVVLELEFDQQMYVETSDDVSTDPEGSTVTGGQTFEDIEYRDKRREQDQVIVSLIKCVENIHGEYSPCQMEFEVSTVSIQRARVGLYQYKQAAGDVGGHWLQKDK